MVAGEDVGRGASVDEAAGGDDVIGVFEDWDSFSTLRWFLMRNSSCFTELCPSIILLSIPVSSFLKPQD